MKVRCSGEVKRNYHGGVAAAITTSLIVAACAGSGSHSALALSYQSGVGVNFTLGSSIGLSLSSADIYILDLAPGTVSDSNIITVKVLSNNANGYTLSSSVGSDTTTNVSGGSFETRNLIHESLDANGDGIASNFASVATNASLTGINDDNTWGYSYLDSDVSSSWANYSGLPLFSDITAATLKVKNGPSAALGDDVKFKIAARASGIQPTGDYNNVINFMVVGAPDPELLYDKVAEMSKGTLAENNVALDDEITTPTSANRADDTSNSGVYKYDPSVFGPASDANNSRDIYFYRGILEPAADNGTYGSDGKATTYPNYVKLGNNTCWRIVRTTGSGGVKMIYNGTWTNGSCANLQNNAAVGSVEYATQGSSIHGDFYQWENNMAYVGYTFNNDVTDSTTPTALGVIFGNDDNPGLNNTRSNIKTYIEDTWYATTMTAYTDKLEPSAGYCFDRSVYNSSGILQDETVTTSPYLSYYESYDFGARHRLLRTGASVTTPSLTCLRSIVDLYRYEVNSAGVANELKYPTALIGADEVALAGNGQRGITSSNIHSFLGSGFPFYLFSPASVPSTILSLDRDCYIQGVGVSSNIWVRPAISLKPGTFITGGTGIATDPWTIE